VAELVCCRSSAISRTVSKSESLSLPVVLFANTQAIFIWRTDCETRCWHAEAASGIDRISGGRSVMVESEVAISLEVD
jgi:hypothetical protein